MLNFKGWFESFPNISQMGKVQYKAKQSYTATTDHSSQESLHYHLHASPTRVCNEYE